MIPNILMSVAAYTLLPCSGEIYYMSFDFKFKPTRNEIVFLKKPTSAMEWMFI